MFSVEPWEVGSDAFAFDEFHSVKLEGAEWELAWNSASIENDLWFRRQNGPLIYLPPTFESMWKDDTGEISLEMRQAMFEEGLTNQRWRRMLFFKDETELRSTGAHTRFYLRLFPKGDNRWWEPKTAIESRFSWSRSEDFLLNASVEEVLERLQTEPTKSRWAYARAFTGLDKVKRRGEVWEWTSDNQENFRSLLLGALLVQNELWQDSLHVTLRVNFISEDENKGITLILHDGRVRSTPALREIVQAVTDHYGPHIHNQHLKEHLCLRDLLNRNVWELDIDLETLTAHERIEAALKWREWLAEHGASA